MGYIVCDKCGGYYELQEGDSPNDFELICNCGGSLYYADDLDEFLEDYKRVSVDRKFKQRMEQEKLQKSTSTKDNHHSNTEFLILLIIGLFVILLFGWRIIVNIFFFFEFPLNILLFIGLIIIGIFIFLLFVGTKKY